MDMRFTRSKWGTILWGIAGIVLGVFVFLNPSTAMETLTIAVGWVLTIFGIASLLGAFTDRSIILSNVDLYNGILSLLFGLLILAAPKFFVSFIFILLGIYIIMGGFSALMGANALRVVGIGSIAGMIWAVFSIILGFMVIASPWAAAGTTMLLCGVSLIYTGVVHVLEGIKMPSDRKKKD